MQRKWQVKEFTRTNEAGLIENYSVRVSIDKNNQDFPIIMQMFKEDKKIGNFKMDLDAAAYMQNLFSKYPDENRLSNVAPSLSSLLIRVLPMYKIISH